MSLQNADRVQITPVEGMVLQETSPYHAEAFEELVTRYDVMLFRFVFHFLSDYALARDVWQHSFLQLYLALPSLSTERSVKAWLFKVARNRCIDTLRRERRRPLYFSELESGEEDEENYVYEHIADPGPLPEEIAEQHDVHRILEQAVQSLSLRAQQVVFLRFEGHMSYSNIANRMGIPEATAKTYAWRARRVLQKTIPALLDETE